MAGELIRREALERIIQRAAELQAGEQDIGEGLTEPELLALGQDCGIPSRYPRQALLEEQTRPTAEARATASSHGSCAPHDSLPSACPRPGGRTPLPFEHCLPQVARREPDVLAERE